MQALIHAFIGDLLALDFFLRDAVRKQVTEVIVDFNMASRVSDLVPIVFPNLKNIIVCNDSVSNGARFVYYKASRAAILDAFPQLSDDVLELRQWHSFFWCQPYLLPRCVPAPVSKGIFLTEKHADIRKFELPAGYIVLHPASAWSHQPGRDFVINDFFMVDQLSKRYELPVVVIGNRSIPPTIKKRPRYNVVAAQTEALCNKFNWLNLTDQTTKLETIEIVKAASIFVGASSCWSILAAAHFPENAVLVKPDDNFLKDEKMCSFFYPFATKNIFSSRPLQLSDIDRIQR